MNWPQYIALAAFNVGMIYAMFRQLRKDVNGLGWKTRKSVAEIIILSKQSPDFDAIVRRLLG